MRIEFLRQRLRDCGALPCHEERVLRAWLAARPLDSGPKRRSAENYFPLEVRELLVGLDAELATLAQLRG